MVRCEQVKVKDGHVKRKLKDEHVKRKPEVFLVKLKDGHVKRKAEVFLEASDEKSF